MPDSKITALTALTAADPANDMFPVVDVSDTTMAASGTTKRISINNILACSPSATLASATITGDLTVDTNVLKVDTTNNRVGIGTASPGLALDIVGSARVTYGQSYNSFTSGGSNSPMLSCQTFDSVGNIVILQNPFSDLVIGTSTTGTSTERYRVSSNGGHTWSNVGGVAGTAMTLNASGLGVGASPANNLHIKGASGATAIRLEAITDGTLGFIGSASGLITGSPANNLVLRAENGLYLSGGGNATQFILNSSGNVGIGVTPSAWRNTQKALQVGAVGTYFSSAASTGSTCIGRNVYESTAGNFTYIVNDEATFYEQTATGTHAWYTAAAGTGTIAFGDAKMTLDASGNLLCGSTALNATWNTRLTLSSDSGTTRWAVGPYSTATNFVISAASGGGVYLNGTAATSWTSASDERLKDIIEPISNAVAKVGSLRAVIGKFKFDENNTRKPFLIAQDLQSVLPEAVDASNPDQLGVAYTDVIPLLVAAIKELTARVQTLETR